MPKLNNFATVVSDLYQEKVALVGFMKAQQAAVLADTKLAPDMKVKYVEELETVLTEVQKFKDDIVMAAKASFSSISYNRKYSPYFEQVVKSWSDLINVRCQWTTDQFTFIWS